MQTQSAGTAVYMGAEGGVADAHVSGVSWGAVFAGAAAAAALSMILLILGVGLGLSSVSPWSYNVSAIGTSTIVWIAFVQLAASGVGGYLAGRLRIKWASVHTHEVYFRDTAHGMLTWAVASLITATLLAGAVRAILSGAIDLGAGAGAAVAPMVAAATVSAAPNNTSDSTANPIDYFSDMLLRSDQAPADANSGAMRSEVSKIFVTDLRAGRLTPEDRDYLARTIVKRTGMNQTDAERRVDDIYARVTKASADTQAAAKEAAETARKAAAHSALWMFVALLIGAFVASLAATFGGRQRDGMQVYVRS